MNPAPTKPLTTNQAARLARVSGSTMLRACEAGKVKTSRTPGGHFRIQREDLGAFIQAMEGGVNLQDRVKVLEEAVRWALGENGDFRKQEHQAKYLAEGKYWWRRELRRRAALT